MLCDITGRLRGLERQRLDLLRHDCKSLAGRASARRLDRGVERQQIRLLGHRRDQLDDLADPRGPLGLLGDERVGLSCLPHRFIRDPARFLDLVRDLAHRLRKLLGGAGDCPHIGGSLLRRGGNMGRKLSGRLCGQGQVLGR